MKASLTYIMHSVLYSDTSNSGTTSTGYQNRTEHIFI